MQAQVYQELGYFSWPLGHQVLDSVWSRTRCLSVVTTVIVLVIVSPSNARGWLEPPLAAANSFR